MKSDVQPRSWLYRREFLTQVGTGMGSIALACMLAEEAQAQQRTPSPVAPKPPMYPAKAKRVVQIFCPGAVSHLDTFEYKPELIKRHGQPLRGEKLVTFQGTNGNIMKSPWEWKRAGQTGKYVSSLLPHLSECIDDMAFVHSLTARSNTHGPALLQMNTGYVVDGYPSMGAWTLYALGSETQNLPAFVSIPDVRGLPPNGPANWGSGFLPAAFQHRS